MEYEKSCGALVYRKFHGNTEILLVKNASSGHWSFPKGHVEAGETEEQTAMREIMEETGIEVILDTSFRELILYAPKKNIKKQVVYFLARAINHNYTPQEAEISQIKWTEIKHAGEILTYDNDKRVVRKATTLLK